MHHAPDAAPHTCVPRAEPNPIPKPSPSPSVSPQANPCVGNASQSTQAKEVRFDEHYPPSAKIDPTDWLNRQGIRKQKLRPPCWDLGDNVGSPPNPGLMCLRESKSPPATTAVIYRANGGKLERVWEAFIATWGNWLELTPILQKDGLTLKLNDRTPRSCAGAKHEYREKEESGIDADFGSVLFRGCAAVGTYVWRGNHFVWQFADPVPPSSSDDADHVLELD